MEAEQKSLKRKINVLNRRAWQVRISDSDQAFKSSKEAVSLARNINYAKGQADGLIVEAFGYIRLSDFNQASLCLDEAFEIYKSLNDLRGLSVVFEYFGIIQRYKGNSGTALESIFNALDLSRQTNFTENEITNLYQLGVTYWHLAEYDKALDYLFNSLSLARSTKFYLMEGYDLNVIGSIYFETRDFQQALNYYEQGLYIRRQAGDKWGSAGSLDNIGYTYLKINNYQQAIDYCNKSLEITRSTGDKKGQANALIHLAEIYKQINKPEAAEAFCNESLEIRKTTGDKRGVAEILLFLTELYKTNDDNGRIILKYLSDVLQIAEEIKANDILSKMHYRLYEYYKWNRNFEEAIFQLELHIAAEEKLHKETINQKVLNLEITYKAEEAKKEVVAIRLKNEELTTLNSEIEKQKNKLIDTLAELKSTQAQLIQSEKMASLGELTAGIAHEIQNPLNFINNFSDVNAELIEELEQEAIKGNIAEVKALARDLIDNQQKINHHGKRADAIVKGMLQHSRASTNEKELIDINALVNEYLRLSYQGLRAKDKFFSSKLNTQFDANIGKVKILPQDIGRVLLNLYSNAFYAVNQKQKQNLPGYEPVITVKTLWIPQLGHKGGDVVISVSDNGAGISPKVMGKIFQPFFTTKPTGQGTGLGLSLSYDIVKAHGGELKLETKEGEGSEFVIQLPFHTT